MAEEEESKDIHGAPEIANESLTNSLKTESSYKSSKIEQFAQNEAPSTSTMRPSIEGEPSKQSLQQIYEETSRSQQEFQKSQEMSLGTKKFSLDELNKDVSYPSQKPRTARLHRVCQRRFREIIGKRELKNEELEKQQGDLKQRLNILECSMPAVMVWNIWRMSQSQGPGVPSLQRVLEKQFLGPASGEVYCPRTPSRHFDCRVREVEAERKQAQKKAEEARSLWAEREVALEDKSKKLEEARKVQEEIKEKITKLAVEAKALREAASRVKNEGECETGECGLIECKKKWLENVPSSASIKSTDIECLDKLQQLAETELCMKRQIADLERREEAYMRTLEQADELWAKLQGDAASTLSALQEQLDMKTAANQQMADRIVELEDALEKMGARMAACRGELEKYMSISKIDALIGRDDDFASILEKGVDAEVMKTYRMAGRDDDIALADDTGVMARPDASATGVIARPDTDNALVGITPEDLAHEEEKIDEAKKLFAAYGSLSELWTDDDYVCPPDFACNDQVLTENGLTEEEMIALKEGRVTAAMLLGEDAKREPSIVVNRKEMVKEFKEVMEVRKQPSEVEEKVIDTEIFDEGGVEGDKQVSVQEIPSTVLIEVKARAMAEEGADIVTSVKDGTEVATLIEKQSDVGTVIEEEVAFEAVPIEDAKLMTTAEKEQASAMAEARIRIEPAAEEQMEVDNIPEGKREIDAFYEDHKKDDEEQMSMKTEPEDYMSIEDTIESDNILVLKDELLSWQDNVDRIRDTIAVCPDCVVVKEGADYLAQSIARHTEREMKEIIEDLQRKDRKIREEVREKAPELAAELERAEEEDAKKEPVAHVPKAEEGVPEAIEAQVASTTEGEIEEVKPLLTEEIAKTPMVEVSIKEDIKLTGAPIDQEEIENVKLPLVEEITKVPVVEKLVEAKDELPEEMVKDEVPVLEEAPVPMEDGVEREILPEEKEEISVAGIGKIEEDVLPGKEEMEKTTQVPKEEVLELEVIAEIKESVKEALPDGAVGVEKPPTRKLEPTEELEVELITVEGEEASAAKEVEPVIKVLPEEAKEMEGVPKIEEEAEVTVEEIEVVGVVEVEEAMMEVEETLKVPTVSIEGVREVPIEEMVESEEILKKEELEKEVIEVAIVDEVEIPVRLCEEVCGEVCGTDLILAKESSELPEEAPPSISTVSEETVSEEEPSLPCVCSFLSEEPEDLVPEKEPIIPVVYPFELGPPKEMVPEEIPCVCPTVAEVVETLPPKKVIPEELPFVCLTVTEVPKAPSPKKVVPEELHSVCPTVTEVLKASPPKKVPMPPCICTTMSVPQPPSPKKVPSPPCTWPTMVDTPKAYPKEVERAPLCVCLTMPEAPKVLPPEEPCVLPCMCFDVQDKKGPSTRIEITQTSTSKMKSTAQVITQTVSETGTQTIRLPIYIQSPHLYQQSKVTAIPDTIEPQLDILKQLSGRTTIIKEQSLILSTTVSCQTEKSVLTQHQTTGVGSRTASLHISEIIQSLKSEVSYMKSTREEEIKSIHYDKKEEVTIGKCNCCMCGQEVYEPFSASFDTRAKKGKQPPITVFEKCGTSPTDQGVQCETICPGCILKISQETMTTQVSLRSQLTSRSQKSSQISKRERSFMCDKEIGASVCVATKGVPYTRLKKKTDQSCTAKLYKIVSKMEKSCKREDSLREVKEIMAAPTVKSKKSMHCICSGEIESADLGVKKKVHCSCGD